MPEISQVFLTYFYGYLIIGMLFFFLIDWFYKKAEENGNIPPEYQYVIDIWNRNKVAVGIQLIIFWFPLLCLMIFNKLTPKK